MMAFLLFAEVAFNFALRRVRGVRSDNESDAKLFLFVRPCRQWTELASQTRGPGFGPVMITFHSLHYNGTSRDVGTRATHNRTFGGSCAAGVSSSESDLNQKRLKG